MRRLVQLNELAFKAAGPISQNTMYFSLEKYHVYRDKLARVSEEPI